jgi:hypothetical protein
MTPESSHIASLEARIEELEKAHASTRLYYLLRGVNRLSQWAVAHRGEPVEEGLNYAVRRLYELAEEVKNAPITKGEIEVALNSTKQTKQ